ncbi:MAG: flagellar hook-basal body protein [Candidatus Eremiobacteraeota bacterium]|nr:flagellar hook-basal body protein [Candidatus Eremiobacteraeota bacterium]MBC5826780.1 flagellar hook-basal body protein [Candidatus Eremiobacteraeota bacterium]
MDIPDALTSAGAGMRLQTERLDVIADNLANAGTVAYRARRWIGRAFGERLESATASSSAQGTLRRTDVPTDMALIGDGYFTVMTPQGTRYTRDGRFSPNGRGGLADAQGNPVLGMRGSARLPRGARVEADGTIVAGGRVVDRLRIVSADGHPEADGPDQVAQTSTRLSASHAVVRSGYLEESGVDPIAEMTALVSSQRAFEANQKALQRADEALKRAVTEVPSVRS